MIRKSNGNFKSVAQEKKSKKASIIEGIEKATSWKDAKPFILEAILKMK